MDRCDCCSPVEFTKAATAPAGLESALKELANEISRREGDVVMLTDILAIPPLAAPTFGAECSKAVEAPDHIERLTSEVNFLTLRVQMLRPLLERIRLSVERLHG